MLLRTLGFPAAYRRLYHPCMRRLSLMIGILLFSSCTAVTPPAAMQRPSSIDLPQMYENKQAGFSFRYPAGWQADDTHPPSGDQPVLVALYTPEGVAGLQSCGKKNPTENQVANCDNASAYYEVTVMQDVYVDYPSLDAVSKSNYPGYMRVSASGADVFEIAGTPGSSGVSFHINNPNRLSGLTLGIGLTNATRTADLAAIAASFRFTESGATR